MSEQQNKDLIQSVYDAFGRGDIQTILNKLADDVDWTLEGPSVIPFTGKRKGVAQVKQFFDALATTQTNHKLTMEPLIAQGDQVAGLGLYAAGTGAGAARRLAGVTVTGTLVGAGAGSEARCWTCPCGVGACGWLGLGSG